MMMMLVVVVLSVSFQVCWGACGRQVVARGGAWCCLFVYDLILNLIILVATKNTDASTNSNTNANTTYH
jgi:hypothetical protein